MIAIRKSMVLSILLLVAIIPLTAQVKYEKEERIKASQVPDLALQFMRDSGIDSKIKWYREISQQGIHLEGKVVHRGIKHSIEFDTLGQVLDIEREFKLKELNPQTAANIIAALKPLFQKYRIRKIQAQWTGNSAILVALMNKKEVKPFRLRYEIVIRGKKEEGSGLFEVLLEPSGTLVEMLEISQRAADNLDF